METTRFILLIALALMLTLIWQAWQEDYVIPNKPDYRYETNIGATVTEVKPSDIPNVDTIELETTQAATVDAPTLSNTQTMGGEIIQVKTDVFEIEINTLGGTVQRLALTEYPLIKNQKDQPIILLRNTPDDFYLMQGGLLGEGDVANHKTLFQIERTNYELNGVY
ncbi:MAG: membrane protein insertase YidC [Proteobacteria bacterium]|nr:membrane protein insertase YidC [Pseudomonadota bacterium]